MSYSLGTNIHLNTVSLGSVHLKVLGGPKNGGQDHSEFMRPPLNPMRNLHNPPPSTPSKITKQAL